jgi:hypothetical protein
MARVFYCSSVCRAEQRLKRCCEAHLELGVESGVAGGLVPVDVEPAGHMGQQLGQLHGVPGAAPAARLREGVGAPFVVV